jgi:hypothetical protein
VHRGWKLLLPSDRGAIAGAAAMQAQRQRFDLDQAGPLPDAYFFNCENAAAREPSMARAGTTILLSSEISSS